MTTSIYKKTSWTNALHLHEYDNHVLQHVRSMYDRHKYDVHKAQALYELMLLLMGLGLKFRF